MKDVHYCSQNQTKSEAQYNVLPKIFKYIFLENKSHL